MLKKDLIKYFIYGTSIYISYKAYKNIIKNIKLLYIMKREKKNSIKNLKKYIGNLNNNNKKEIEINTFFDAKIDNNIKDNLNNNNYLIKKKRVFENNIFYDNYKICKNYNLIDPEEENFKFKNINLDNIDFFNTKIYKKKIDIKFENVFSFLWKIITFQNFMLKVHKEDYLILSGSKLSLIGKIIFDLEKKEIKSFEIFNLAENTKKLEKLIFSNLKISLFTFGIFSFILLRNLFIFIKDKKENIKFSLLFNKKIKSEKEELNCLICMTFIRNIILYPCKHLSLCDHCYDIYKKTNKNCVVCKKFIKKIVKIKFDK